MKTAKENDSVEVAMLFDDDRKAISTVIGTATEVDLNVPGRTAAKYVMHNHPNNQSFSNKDVVWLLKNPNVRYFSIVKNNGKSEIIYLPENFDATKLKIEYKRLTKKYSKEIAQSKERGYNSVISDLLSKTKSNLIYWR